MTLESFNTRSHDDAAAAIRPCADIDRWVDAVVAGRPYDTVGDALTLADREARTWDASDVDAALAHHPRIGERAGGDSAEAALSRTEQASVGADADAQRALLEGNRAYEERFGRVFLIRAAGRSADEILAELQRRLTNDAETESTEVAEQLREIALLRLEGTLTA